MNSRLQRFIYDAYFETRRRMAAATLGPAAAELRVEPGAPVLIAALGLIGDGVMCLPAIIALRDVLPANPLHALVNSTTHQLFDAADVIDRFLIYDGSALPLRLSQRAVLKRIEQQIRVSAPCLAVILTADDYIPMLRRARVTAVLADSRTRYAHQVTATYPVRLRELNHVDRLEAARALGYGGPNFLPRLHIKENSRSLARELMGDISGGGAVVLLHPFASSAMRALPPALLESVLDEVENIGATFLLIGSAPPEVLHACQRLRTRCHDLVGRLSLEQTCALIAEADLTVSTDSGPLHLAGALGRPAIGLFRAIRPEYAHLYPSVEPVMWPHGDQCLPGCCWDSLSGCARLPCIQLAGIDPGDVAAAIRSQLVGRDLKHASAD